VGLSVASRVGAIGGVEDGVDVLGSDWGVLVGVGVVIAVDLGVGVGVLIGAAVVEGVEDTVKIGVFERVGVGFIVFDSLGLFDGDGDKDKDEEAGIANASTISALFKLASLPL